MVDTGAGADGVVVVTLAVLVALAAGLLVPAGIAKLRDPSVARAALGLPRRTEPVLRVLGAGELLLAVAVLAVATWPVVAGLALAYAGFTAVALRQRAQGASCGCFGASQTPTGWHHVLLDGGAALTALAAALVGVPPARELVAAGTPTGVVLLVAGAVAVVTLQQLITTLPELATARRTAGGSS